MKLDKVYYLIYWDQRTYENGIKNPCFIVELTSNFGIGKCVYDFYKERKVNIIGQEYDLTEPALKDNSRILPVHEYIAFRMTGKIA